MACRPRRLSDPDGARFTERHLPRIVLYLMVATLVAVVLLPHVVVTVPSGYVGVLWKRFGNGTVLDPRQLRGEGLRFLLPWNQLFLYDLRLQSMTETYNAISGDGVSLTATMNVRFRLQRNAIPVLHQAVGPDYLNLLVKPGIGSLTREVMAEYTAEQVYSTARQEIQDKIRGLVESRLSQKMMEHEGEEESYRISLTGYDHPFRHPRTGHRAAPGRGRSHQSQNRAVLHFGRVRISRSARKTGVLNARRSRQKVSETSSRSSVKASRIPICVGGVLRRRFSLRNPTIRRW